MSEPMQISITGLIHYPRLKERLATHFVPFAQFEADAANGDLPDFSLIEPSLTIGHNDYHPGFARVLGHGVVIPSVDPPSSVLGGEAFLSRIYNAYRGMQSPSGPNVWDTTLLIGWDEPGGTYDHVAPGPVPPPDPAAPAGECGFAFDRSGYRVPAIIISPWVAEGDVFNEEHRHTSLIATLRDRWGLGAPFTARDAGARTFSDAFALDAPREPGTWPVPRPRPVARVCRGPRGAGKGPVHDRQGLPGLAPWVRRTEQPQDRRFTRRPECRHTPRTGRDGPARRCCNFLPSIGSHFCQIAPAGRVGTAVIFGPLLWLPAA